ncbi:MAG: hypothetical protein GY794_10175 [bacterium]|nr:hypothetical protein [bacterium]
MNAMTSDMDYNLHKTIGPSEIFPHPPLSGRKDRKKGQLSGQKKSGKKPMKIGEKTSSTDDSEHDSDNKTPKHHKPGDHEIDCYA